MNEQDALAEVKIYIKVKDYPTAYVVYAENFNVSHDQAVLAVNQIISLQNSGYTAEEQAAIASLQQFMQHAEKLVGSAEEFAEIRQAAHDINGRFMLIMHKRRKNLL